MNKNKKIAFLISAIINFLLLIIFTFFGFATFRIWEGVIKGLNVQLPFYTQLWLKFFWLPPIIFLALAIWSFIKFKKS